MFFLADLVFLKGLDFVVDFAFVLALTATGFAFIDFAVFAFIDFAVFAFIDFAVFAFIDFAVFAFIDFAVFAFIDFAVFAFIDFAVFAFIDFAVFAFIDFAVFAFIDFVEAFRQVAVCWVEPADLGVFFASVELRTFFLGMSIAP